MQFTAIPIELMGILVQFVCCADRRKVHSISIFIIIRIPHIDCWFYRSPIQRVQFGRMQSRQKLDINDISVFCAAFVRVARETQAICVTGFCCVFVFSIFRVQKLSIYFSFSSVNQSVYAVLCVCVWANMLLFHGLQLCFHHFFCWANIFSNEIAIGRSSKSSVFETDLL